MSEPLPVLEIEGGLIVTARTKLSTDWASMKVLVESGVPLRDVAKTFKVSNQMVSKKAREEGWLSPSKVESMRKEIVSRQAEVYRRSGKTMDVGQIKAEIWKERTEHRNEKIHQIVMNALEGVDAEKARKMIKSPLSLLHITQASRLITGEEQLEAQAPQVAVNIGFLRSQRPVDVVVEAQEA